MSEKNRDVKNRWRTVTVAFRLSPEENEELTNRVKMCGCRTRQEYIIQSILHQKVVATGNPLMLVSFRQNLQHIEAELERLQKVDEMDSELLTPIRTMLEIFKFTNFLRDSQICTLFFYCFAGKTCSYKILTTIIDKFRGGPVGVSTIATAIGEDGAW